MQTEKNLDSQARKRLELLFDDGEYTEIGSFVKEKSNLTGVITAFGYVNGNPVYAFSQDIAVEKAAVGTAQAAKIKNIYELAAKTGCPVVEIHDSNGAFIDGSTKSLSAYGEMLSASAAVSGVVPQIAVVSGACVGCAAMLAISADFLITTEKSDIGMASLDEKSDIKKLSSIACKDDAEAFKKARDIINLMPVNNLAGAPRFNFDEPQAVYDGSFSGIKTALCDPESVVEIAEAVGEASYTALATIGGQTVGIVATNKKSVPLTSEDSSKIARFVRTCDAFALPVVTFVESAGFEKEGIEGIKSMTRLLASYSEATTAKISVVTGDVIGTAFVALAGKNVNSDFTFAFENAVISPMNPLAAAEFLWHDKLSGAADLEQERNKLADEYKETIASAEAAANEGAVDDIIAPEETRKTLVSVLEALSGKRITKLPKKHNNIPF